MVHEVAVVTGVSEGMRRSLPVEGQHREGGQSGVTGRWLMVHLGNLPLGQHMHHNITWRVTKTFHRN